MVDKKMVEIISKSPLFKDIEEKELQEILNSSIIKTFEKGELVFQETDKPDGLLILLSGELMVCKDTFSGKRLIITTISSPGDMFGEVYPFIGVEQYDMYVEAKRYSKILILDVNFLTESEKIRENLLFIFAQKAYTMNRRLRVLGATGIRGKLARFIVDRQVEEKKKNIKINMSREQMADFLNVTRPSLSREMGAMIEEGILSLNGKILKVVNQEALEKWL